MDILKFNTEIGKGIASMVISNLLSRKLGYTVKIDLSTLSIRNDNHTVKITFAGTATAPTDQIKI